MPTRCSRPSPRRTAPCPSPAWRPLSEPSAPACSLLLKTLEVEDAVTKIKGGYISTGRGWTYDQERYEKVAAVRAAEAQAMLDYEVHP